jgi:hypothetical protein
MLMRERETVVAKVQSRECVVALVLCTALPSFV